MSAEQDRTERRGPGRRIEEPPHGRVSTLSVSISPGLRATASAVGSSSFLGPSGALLDWLEVLKGSDSEDARSRVPDGTQ